MIAPLKESTLEHRQAAHWAGARRAVAALLLRDPTEESSSVVPPVSRRATWLFVAWAVAIAAIYLSRGVWWIAPGH
jgi:hypothetical protein